MLKLVPMQNLKKVRLKRLIDRPKIINPSFTCFDISVKVEGEALVCPKLACPDKQFPSFSVSMRVVDKGADKGGRQVVARRYDH